MPRIRNAGIRLCRAIMHKKFLYKRDFIVYIMQKRCCFYSHDHPLMSMYQVNEDTGVRMFFDFCCDLGKERITG